jgi:hypothetical protein
MIAGLDPVEGARMHAQVLEAMRLGASGEGLKRLFLRAVEAREPFWKPQKEEYKIIRMLQKL